MKMQGVLWGVLAMFAGLAAGVSQNGPRGPRAAPAANLPESAVTITEEGAYRMIEGNGIPNHDHGQFPGRGNPHAIEAQSYRFLVPLHPEAAEEITYFDRQPFGIALNGVPFDPGTAEYWKRDRNSGWRYEALSGKIDLGVDENSAHVQPSGAYHYHGLPKGLVNIYSEKPAVVMLGYAADGFPVYAQYGYNDPADAGSGFVEMRSSYRVKEGQRDSGPGGSYDGTFVEDYVYEEGLGSLDECNGRFGVTPEYPEGIYHYYITKSFPFVPRAFRGTPHESFERRRGAGQGPGRGQREGRERREGGPQGRPR